VSYSNDFFDIEVDQHSDPTSISGGSGILLQNPDLRNFSKWFAIVLMALSVIFSVFFLFLFSFPITFLIFVVIGNLFGWFYAAPPLKLSYRGLSEIMAIVMIGLMIPGMGYFILKRGFDALFLLFTPPSMLYGLAFIISVEIPDLEGDKLGKKNTLIVRTDRKFGFFLIASSYSFATAYFLILSLLNSLPRSLNYRFLTLLSMVPLVFGIHNLIHRTENREKATRLVTYNILGLSLFLVLLNSYLLYLVLAFNTFP